MRFVYYQQKIITEEIKQTIWRLAGRPAIKMA
jgi:hypothetical protein